MGGDEFEERLSAAARRIEEVAEDATAARHLAAAGDRDLADLTAQVLATQRAIDGLGVRITGVDGRVDALGERVTTLGGRVDANTAALKANTAALNQLSVQTGERFGAIDRRFGAIDKRFGEVDRRFVALETTVDNGFAEIRGRLDQTAAGLDLIVKLLTPGEGSSEGATEG